MKLRKPSANYSPDVFVQLALQLAYYRLRGHTTPVYETALTRSFHHGCSETIRSLTFVRMCGPWKGWSQKGYTTEPAGKNQRDEQHKVVSGPFHLGLRFG